MARSFARELLLVVLAAAAVSSIVGAAMSALSGRGGWGGAVISALLVAAVSVPIVAALYALARRLSTERAVAVAAMAMSDSERALFRAIEESGGEVRQDRLRGIVHLSKSEVSALANNLERKGVITKTRYYRTNILRLTKEFGGRASVERPSPPPADRPP